MARAVKTDRRKFMGLLAGGVVGARGAAEKAFKATGIGVSGNVASSVCPSIGQCSDSSRWSLINSLRGCLPSWKERDIRENARFVQTLDADISVLHSVSLVRKVSMQRERNYQRQVTEFFSWPKWGKEREQYLKKHNLDWL